MFVDCPSCLPRLIRAALQLSPPCSWHCKNLDSAFLFLRQQHASSVCFDNDSYKPVYSKQTQWEATTKPAALAAGVKRSPLLSCVRGGMVLHCVHPALCVLGIRSFALGVGRGEPCIVGSDVPLVERSLLPPAPPCSISRSLCQGVESGVSEWGDPAL